MGPFPYQSHDPLTNQPLTHLEQDNLNMLAFLKEQVLPQL